MASQCKSVTAYPVRTSVGEHARNSQTEVFVADRMFASSKVLPTCEELDAKSEQSSL